MVRMAKCPTKIRVYGSKGMANRNVGVRLARKRSKVRFVGKEILYAVKGGMYLEYTLEDNACRTKGLT